MKSKVINLFNDPPLVQNTGVKYSVLLEQLIEPYIEYFAETEDQKDIIDFAINVWNIANMKVLLLEDEIDNTFNFIQENDVGFNLLTSMVDYKINHFKTYTNFIIDFELKKIKGDTILKVITQEEITFLGAKTKSVDAEQSESKFNKNCINRNAIILSPLKPFKDWVVNLYPDEADAYIESSTYLINEDIDLEEWLKKKYNKLFKIELEWWHTNEKTWPQKRNYKMFNKWFQVDISSMIYDLEDYPISKSE